MNPEQILNIEPKAMKVIELIEKENFQRREETAKEHEFYGDVGQRFENQMRSEKINTHRNLMDFLRGLTLEELKIIRTLILTGQKITEEDIEDEELDNIQNIYDEFYETAPDRAETIIDYILDSSLNLDRYLTNGLMYCSK